MAAFAEKKALEAEQTSCAGRHVLVWEALLGQAESLSGRAQLQTFWGNE